MTARIPAVTLDDADGETRPVLENVKRAIGKVPNLLGVVAHSPIVLRGLLAFEGDLDKHGTLSHREVELIALRMAQLNGCGYCLSAHHFFAGKVGLEADEIDAARAGFAAPVRERAVLDFVTRLVRTGGSGAGGELDELKRAGVDERQTMEIIARVALLGLANAVGALTQPVIDWPLAPRLPQH
jgi:uncharacterized peroxidase-related enzyme